MKSADDRKLHEEIAKLNSTIILMESRILKYRNALNDIILCTKKNDPPEQIARKAIRYEEDT